MGVSVLIVDDHHGCRELVRKLLEAEGYRVVGEVCDGVSAVAAVAALKPEVVLLDVQLPDRDGFQVAHQLIEQAPDCQVVLISCREASDYGGRVAQCGARGFISKDELSGSALNRVLRTAK